MTPQGEGGAGTGARTTCPVGHHAAGDYLEDQGGEGAGAIVAGPNAVRGACTARGACRSVRDGRNTGVGVIYDDVDVNAQYNQHHTHTNQESWPHMM